MSRFTNTPDDIVAAVADLAEREINFNSDMATAEAALRAAGLAVSFYTGSGFGIANGARGLEGQRREFNAEQQRLRSLAEEAQAELDLRRDEYPHAGADDRSLPAGNYNGIAGDDVKEGLVDYLGNPIDYYTLSEAEADNRTGAPDSTSGSRLGGYEEYRPGAPDPFSSDPHNDGVAGHVTSNSTSSYSGQGQFENDTGSTLDFEAVGSISVTEVSYEGGGSTRTVTDEIGNIAHEVTTSGGTEVTYTGTAYGVDPPIIIDLDGDGVEISYGETVEFDIDGDGYIERTSWVGANDGFLVIDLDENGLLRDDSGDIVAGDGEITHANEIVFSRWANSEVTDLQALAEARDEDNNLIFDTNADGVLNESDDLWTRFYIWRDENQNGTSDDGELIALSDVVLVTDVETGQTSVGIDSISLDYEGGVENSDDDITVFGNTLHGLGSLVSEGHTLEDRVGDVSLRNETYGYRPIETLEGYEIQFETGETFRYADLERSGFANVDLTVGWYNGATGNDGANVLDATGHALSVQISGGDGNDTVIGGRMDDLLSGDDGADSLHGGAGNDTLFVDQHDTLIRGGIGYDTAIFVGGGSIYLDMGEASIETAYGGDGDDTFNATTMDYSVSIYGGAGGDTILGGNESDILSGDNGVDTIQGRIGDDTILGGARADTLDGDAGEDFILGGDNDDVISGGRHDDTLYGGTGVDTIHGNQDDDFIYGARGDDLLYGDGGDDELRGGLGNDLLEDTEGDNFLDGGEGDDTFVVGSAMGRNIIFGGVGDDRLQLEGVEADWTITNISGSQGQWQVTNGTVVHDIVDIETIEFTGDGSEHLVSGADVEADNSDTFSATSASTNPLFWWQGNGAGNAFGNSWQSVFVEDYTNHRGDNESRTHHLLTGADEIFAYAGDDQVNAGNGNDTVDGGSGADAINGEAGNDTIHGGTGSDRLTGGSGNDALTGGSGDDAIFGGIGDDDIDGGTGGDFLYGEDGIDTIDGEMGADFISGGAGADVLSGDEGEDTIYGGLGNDTINGGRDGDFLSGNEGDDVINGDTGNDTIYGGEDNDDLNGGIGFDALYGGDGNDTLNGGDDDDFISGGDGDDDIRGGSGNDFLLGGAGTDVLRGGAGVDTASFAYVDLAMDRADTWRGGIELTLSDGAGEATTGNGSDDITSIENVIGSRYSDTIYGDDQHNSLFGADGHDLLTGGGGNDTIDGGVGNDVLRGGTGYDRLLGGDGDDMLVGGSGEDVLVGGDGIDTAAYYDATIGVTVDLYNTEVGADPDAIVNTGIAYGDVFSSIENVIGSDGNDVLLGDQGDNELVGRDGDDVIRGRRGDDTMEGGGGADTFQFFAGFDNDTITDFEDDVDEIFFSISMELTSVADALSHATEVGNNVVFDFGGGNVLTVNDVTIDELNNDIQVNPYAA